MVGLGVKSSLLAIVLAATLFAGCVGDDDKVDAEKTEGTETGTETTTAPKDGGGGAKKTETVDKEKDAAKAGCQFTFCIEGHVYAPVWDVGMTWTYDVAGSYYPVADYSATIGVFKINDDHFLVGSDSEDELRNSVARLGVMTGQVQKDSYGVLEHDAYQDLLGFLKIEDTTWKSTLWDKEFTLIKAPSKEIEHAKGKSLGIEVTGATEEGDTLLIQYASDVAWLTKLEWTGPDGNVLLSYTLTDYNHDGNTADMKIWDRVDWIVVRATGNTAPVGAQRWIASGTASFVLLHVETDEGTLGQARAIKPSGQMEEFDHSGGEIEDRTTAFETGDWALNILTDRGSMSGSQMAMFVYQINERGL